jgi:uncharacterized lipoprotein YbaY
MEIPMRSLLPLALAAAISLAACGNQQQSASAPAGAGAATPAATAQAEATITGTVGSDQAVALGANAQLTVRLLDVTKTDGEPIVVTEQTYAVTQLPSEFSLAYDPARIEGFRAFAVDARVMEQGAARFVSTARVPVLTQGAGERVAIQLAAGVTQVVRDPVADLVKEYTDFESRLGGFKRYTGDRIVGPENNQVAIGWDAFGDDDGIRMVRERTSNADGVPLSSSQYAFRDGKPWVFTREAGGSKIRIGWDKDGQVILKLRDGMPGEVSDAEIADLTKAGREAGEIATASRR